MKISEQWVREWVNPSLTSDELAEKLTMSGLEVEDVAPVAQKFSNVIVGQILKIEKHPEADRLNICLVNVGGNNLSIVCGAKNVREEMKVAVATEGAKLPHLTIENTEIRGVASQGMLCSLKDLGLADESTGLQELPIDAPLGAAVWDYLHLSDQILDINITPNRGDCLSVLGLAKEIVALTGAKLNSLATKKIKPLLSDTLAVEVQTQVECPRYVGRVIKGIKADALTPIWIQERLRRSGIRSISPVVDVMNYVMLELGQPMHAFDLAKIKDGICVRNANKDEKLLLLDGNTADLTKETLIIADREKPLAIAGVMGGMDSGVTLLTENIFLESAYFNSQTIAKAVRFYHFNSESSQRYERGIDPSIQHLAIERATELLLPIVGGKAGPMVERVNEDALPHKPVIFLRKARIAKFLGLEIEDKEILSILERLEFECKKTKEGWSVTVPTRRPDIALEVDLIEEIVRIYGFDKVPCHLSTVQLACAPCPEGKLTLNALRHSLCDLGYQEVITYSFIDPKLQALLDPHQTPKSLVNPITSDMVMMRTSLWPGLINTLLYNQNRQQTRIRIFETGLRFLKQQEPTLAGLICGNAYPIQWGIKDRVADFFDLKGDLESLGTLSFKPGSHPALHSGQTAIIYREDQAIGIMGALHPELAQKLDIEGKVYLFELALEPLLKTRIPKAKEISKFPEIRRDLALLIDKTVPVQAISDTINEVAGTYLREVYVFDIYEGKGITTDRKSVALALTLQHSSRTLIDEEIAELMDQIIAALKTRFAAELRG